MGTSEASATGGTISAQIAKMMRLVLLCAVAGIALGRAQNPSGGRSSSCTYWCQNFGGDGYYCCDDQNNNNNRNEKRGSCPRVRDFCTVASPGSGPPEPCYGNDYNCPGSDKCCYDRCLNQEVCKPAQYNRNRNGSGNVGEFVGDLIGTIFGGQPQK